METTHQNPGKRALITGVTGQDGSYLAELLLAKGYTVGGLVRRSSSPNTSRIFHLLNRIEIIEGDLLDSGSLIQALRRFQPDEVYNLAAQSHVGTSFLSPDVTMQVTGLGTLRLLEALAYCPVQPRFYQASTSEIIGQENQLLFAPKSPYATAKLYAHLMTQQYRESYGLFACCGILYNHESPRRSPEFVSQKIVRAAVAISQGKQKLLELGNLNAYRDWGYAPDYVHAMWQMLQREKPGDYVVATGESHSVAEFCKLAFGCVCLDWREYVVIDSSLYRPNEVEMLAGRSSLPDWSPTVKFEELVRIMIEAEKNR